MIDIFRDSFEHSDLFDALCVEGVIAAWATDRNGVLAPVKNKKTFVYQAISGVPPTDKELIHLSGLKHTDDAFILVHYQPERPPLVMKSRTGEVVDVLPATQAQWGMLVRKYEDTVSAQEMHL